MNNRFGKDLHFFHLFHLTLGVFFPYLFLIFILLFYSQSLTTVYKKGIYLQVIFILRIAEH